MTIIATHTAFPRLEENGLYADPVGFKIKGWLRRLCGACLIGKRWRRHLEATQSGHYKKHELCCFQVLHSTLRVAKRRRCSSGHPLRVSQQAKPSDRLPDALMPRGYLSFFCFGVHFRSLRSWLKKSLSLQTEFPLQSWWFWKANPTRRWLLPCRQRCPYCRA
jgi:hypothetical protein